MECYTGSGQLMGLCCTSWFCLKSGERALNGVHDEVGHLGYERALDLVLDSFGRRWQGILRTDVTPVRDVLGGKRALKKQFPWNPYRQFIPLT